MIPAAGPTGFLPRGIHPALWPEFRSRYDFTTHRIELLGGLKPALVEFAAAGCPAVYVGGSFVTSKAEPRDIDCCFEYAHELDWTRLHAADLTSTKDDCARQRARYGCEFHLAHIVIGGFGPVQRHMTFLEFYQQNGGDPVGIVVLDLGSLQ